MSHKPIHMLFTCEHGGFEIPSEYASIFSKSSPWLNSHRGWDFGALNVSKALAQYFQADLMYSQISRLLVDLNRSIGHPQLFSPWTKSLLQKEKQRILDLYYSPYREKVFQSVKQKINSGFPLLHISVHSFIPVWKEKKRKTEIGLLFNPHRKNEKIFCQEWRKAMHELFPQLIIHLNRPYRGNTDGFTESLRQIYSGKNYLGIELEINQKLLKHKTQEKVIQILIESLKILLEKFNWTRE